MEFGNFHFEGSKKVNFGHGTFCSIQRLNIAQGTPNGCKEIQNVKKDQRPDLAYNAASDKVFQLANDDKDFSLQENKALLAVENKARLDFQPKSLDCGT